MNFIRNLNIGMRLALAFGTVLMLLLIVATVGITRIAEVKHALDEIVADDMVKTDLATAMRGSINQRAIAVRNVVLLRDAEHRNAEIDRIKASGAAYAEKNDRFAAMSHDDATSALLARLKSADAATRPLLDKVVALGIANREDDATRVLMDELRPAQDAWLGVLAEMQERQRVESERNVAIANHASAQAKVILFGATFGALVVGIVFALLATRSITRPIGQAVAIAQTVASGDLTSRIVVTTKDETGRLLQALKTMNESLVGLVGEVRDSSDSIATGSAQIATGNADLSHRTEEQASNLQQTAASMEELTATTRQNADTARSATAVVDGASQAAASGGSVVGRVVGTMEQISANSRRIADIIGVIDGIAFQTNILALNAAVEAARAGEQGRGFAVVASEVRGLAQRSASAAKEIKALIVESVQNVEAGSRLAGDAGRSMDDIVSQVQRVHDLIGEISSSSGEQNQGIVQIGDAVAQLDQVTQQNAALVEESAAAAESLRLQANRLSTIVGKFRLA